MADGTAIDRAATDGTAIDLAATDGASPIDLAADLAAPIDQASPVDLAEPPLNVPGLALPDPAGQPCQDPGNFSGCPTAQVCRPYSKSWGRCEGCNPCGNLHAACTASSQCDILFDCYMGSCRNFCPLGTVACGGPPSLCVDVGALCQAPACNGASYGVCSD
jgi:hypothetical protein